MTTSIRIAPIPKLAELREAVLAHSDKRKPKWGFRLAPDIVMELQAQPCTLLSATAKARGCQQAVVSFEGKAVMTAGASAADLKKHKRARGSRSSRCCSSKVNRTGSSHSETGHGLPAVAPTA